MMNRRRRTPRDMSVLAGWLFADLLLGLAMLFFTANTVGQPPPTPTPTATPNLLATSEAGFNALATQSTRQESAAEATAAARATQEAIARQQATATAQALATQRAMSDEERATANAQATASAAAAQATLSAFATEQARNAQDISAMTSAQATAAAQATAQAVAAQATIAAQAAEAASIRDIATQNAASGANALATANAQAAAAQATSAALSANQAASDSARTTAQAQAAAVQATAAALSTQLAIPTPTPAPQISIDPNSVKTLQIQVDREGVVSGNERAVQQARTQLRTVFAPYQGTCRAGVVLTYGYAPDVSPGVALAEAVNGLLPQELPAIFESTAFESIANRNDPDGLVEMKVWFYTGCAPAQG